MSERSEPCRFIDDEYNGNNNSSGSSHYSPDHYTRLNVYFAPLEHSLTHITFTLRADSNKRTPYEWMNAANFLFSLNIFFYPGRLIFIKDNTLESASYQIEDLNVVFTVLLRTRCFFFVILAPIALIICQLFKWCAFLMCTRSSNCEFLAIVEYAVVVVVRAAVVGSIQNYAFQYWFFRFFLTNTKNKKMTTARNVCVYCILHIWKNKLFGTHGIVY